MVASGKRRRLFRRAARVVPLTAPELIAAIRRHGGGPHGLPPSGPSRAVFEASVASCWLDVPSPWDSIIFGADGEDLAEEFVEEWLACMAPALAHYGLPLSVQTVDGRRGGGPREGPGDYTVMINEVRCGVWRAAEWDHSAEPPWDPWLAATLRPLATINTLLASAGSVVRAHVLAAGGNEGIVVLIDPKVVAAMRDSGRYAASAIPEVVAAHS